MSVEERTEIEPIKFNDYDFTLALVIAVYDEVAEIPGEVGHFKAWLMAEEKLGHSKLVDC